MKINDRVFLSDNKKRVDGRCGVQNRADMAEAKFLAFLKMRTYGKKK